MASSGFSQTRLFEIESPSAVVFRADPGAITWSYSRRSTFERCVLQYYFEYFGANRRTAKTDPAKEELHFLKGLSNRHLRTGDLLHRAAATYLRQIQLGNALDIDSWVERTRRLFEADRTYSRRYPDGGNLDRRSKFSPVLLREYHYRQANAELLCDEAEERLLGALRSLAFDSRYSPFLVGACSSDALIEHRVAWRPAGLPCRVEGRIDLAYRNAERATLVDWKLGEADRAGDESLQLSVYALWAAECFEGDPSSMRVCKVHLGSGEIVDFRIDDAILCDARARIAQDVMRMAAVQGYGEAATTEAFTGCAQPAICNGCPFQRICPDGREFIADD